MPKQHRPTVRCDASVQLNHLMQTDGHTFWKCLLLFSWKLIIVSIGKTVKVGAYKTIMSPHHSVGCTIRYHGT